MKLELRLGLALALLAAPLATFAAESSASPGLLGVRTLGASAGFYDVNHTSDDVFSVSIDANLPLATGIDLGLDLTQGWVDNASDTDFQDVSATLTGYLDHGACKPYAHLGLGYEWVSSPSGDDPYWFAAVGTEIALGQRTAVNVFADYYDDFESGDNGSWAANALVNHWVTETVALYGQFSWIEFGDLLYVAGVAWRF